MQDNINYEMFYKSVNEKLKEEENKKEKNYRCENCLRILLSSIEFTKKIQIYNSCTFCNNSNFINSLENFKKKGFSLKSSICNKCGKYWRNQKNNSDENFYYCYNCNLIFCHFCKRKHKEHKIFSNIKQYDSICHKHYYSYTNFCENCNKSLCPECELEHYKEHNIKSLSELFIEEDKLKSYEKIIDDEIDLLKEIKEIKIEIVNKLNNMINEIINFYNIYTKNLNNIIDIHNTILKFYKYAAINQDMCYEQMKSFHNFFNVSNNTKELIKRVKTNNNNNNNIFDYYNTFINFLNDNNNYIIKSSADLEIRKKDFIIINNEINNINQSDNSNEISKILETKSSTKFSSQQ